MQYLKTSISSTAFSRAEERTLVTLPDSTADTAWHGLNHTHFAQKTDNSSSHPLAFCTPKKDVSKMLPSQYCPET